MEIKFLRRLSNIGHKDYLVFKLFSYCLTTYNNTKTLQNNPFLAKTRVILTNVDYIMFNALLDIKYY